MNKEDLKEAGEVILGLFSLLVRHPAGIIAILVMPLFLMFVIWPAPSPIITTVDEQFSGQLGMVNYDHSFFGIGGVSATTLSFQNGTSIVSFTFDKDLSVIVGNNYTVNYQVKYTDYSNYQQSPNPIVKALSLRNSNIDVEIMPVSVIAK